MSNEECNDIPDIKKIPEQNTDNSCDKSNTKSVIDSWLENNPQSKMQGYGDPDHCDPAQSGQIINDGKSMSTINRYSRSIRGCDEAMLKLFNNIVAIDMDGKAWKIPIIWGSQEKAVSEIMMQNVRKDGSLVVDRIKLPMMAIHQSDMQFNQERYTYHRAINYMRGADGKPGFTKSEVRDRDTIFGVSRGIPVDISYTLHAWTLYLEDMNQILEQILLRFSPIAYIDVKGVHWESTVHLDSLANNLDTEPGDQNLRVIKYQINLTAKTYIPQPIHRKKAVLDIKYDIQNDVSEDKVKDIYLRSEINDSNNEQE